MYDIRWVELSSLTTLLVVQHTLFLKSPLCDTNMINVATVIMLCRTTKSTYTTLMVIYMGLIIWGKMDNRKETSIWLWDDRQGTCVQGKHEQDPAPPAFPKRDLPRRCQCIYPIVASGMSRAWRYGQEVYCKVRYYVMEECSQIEQAHSLYHN